jgi:hypothetical protein
VERCEISAENIRGRYILNMISTEFDTANVATSITTEFGIVSTPGASRQCSGFEALA